MSTAGIGDDTPVVAYDDAGGSTAARLWWMLHVLGHPVALLDGGLQAWTGELETGEPDTDPPPAHFTAKPWPRHLIVDADEVERLRHSDEAAVIDVRAAERYRGDVEPIDPVAGHIPGARSVPWAEILQPSNKRFRNAAELRDRYAEAGVDDHTAVLVAHCGSGVTACQALLAFEIAGIPGGVLYAGSWSDWISDPVRPVATGDGSGTEAADEEPATADGSSGRYAVRKNPRTGRSPSR
jgi:thiosulfate/3-mercaptopyruvate sulfurtransferase